MPNKKYKSIPPDVSVHIRYLHQDKLESITTINRRYPDYPRTSIFRHATKPIGQPATDRRIGNKKAGRKKLLTVRDERHLESSLLKLRNEIGNIHSTVVQKHAGLKEKLVSNRTVRRTLNAKGYKCSQCRKKGQLSIEDLNDLCLLVNAKSLHLTSGQAEFLFTLMELVGYIKPIQHRQFEQHAHVHGKRKVKAF